MKIDRGEVSGWAIAGLYFFTGVLVFWPVADLVTNTWPFQVGVLQWRYGFMGLLAGFLHTPILGLALAMVLSYVLRHHSALRALSILSFVGAMVLVVVMLAFPIDVLQVRETVPEAEVSAFFAGALIAELKHFTSFVALVLLSVGGWRTASNVAPKPADPNDPAIVM